jgi:hypothetical protein
MRPGEISAKLLKSGGNIIGNVVLFAMAVFVAYGRFAVVPL